MNLIAGIVSIALACLLFRMVMSNDGPRAERVALTICFGLYLVGATYVTFHGYFDQEPRTTIERLDRFDADIRPGCDPVPWPPAPFENGAGVRVIACA